MRGLRTIAAAALLAAPTALAFFSGGYFEAPRLWAGLVVWIAVALLALAGLISVPRGPARLMLAGLVGLAALTTLSITWSPLRDAALADSERVWLYVGFALLAVSLLRAPVTRAVAPALAAGTAVVASYALATRLLPTLVPSERSVSAGARLDQPLTYWNGMGVLLAFGIVLALHVAADPTRRTWLRTAALAALPAHGLALYLTFSRGSLAALAAGVVVLLALTRDRRALALAVVGLGLGGLLAAVASAFPGVDSLAGDEAARRNEGAIVLVALLLASGVAAAATRAILRGAADDLRSPRALAAAAVAGLVLVAGAVVMVTRDPEPPPREVPSRGADLPTTRARLGTLESNRYEYWQVALDVFADRPLAGVGAHGFQQQWLLRRDIRENAQDAHSLYLETAAELGVIGLILLAAFLAAIGSALRRLLAHPASRPTAIGLAAASACWLVHAALDWDWEMPTVTLLFLAVAGAATAAAGDQLVGGDGREHDQRRLRSEAEARDPVVDEGDDADHRGEREQRDQRDAPATQ